MHQFDQRFFKNGCAALTLWSDMVGAIRFRSCRATAMEGVTKVSQCSAPRSHVLTGICSAANAVAPTGLGLGLGLGLGWRVWMGFSPFFVVFDFVERWVRLEAVVLVLVQQWCGVVGPGLLDRCWVAWWHGAGVDVGVGAVRWMALSWCVFSFSAVTVGVCCSCGVLSCCSCCACAWACVWAWVWACACACWAATWVCCACMCGCARAFCSAVAFWSCCNPCEHA